MNSNHTTASCSSSRIRGLTTLGLVLMLPLGFSPAALATTEASAPDNSIPPAEAGAPASKVYHLYVGADIDVPLGDVYHRMQRFTNYSAEIRVEGRVRRVPIRDAGGMRVGRDMKLSVDTATLTEVKVERAYTGARDPFRAWASAGLTGAAATTTTMERNPNIPQPSRGPGGSGMQDLRFEAVESMTHESFSNSGNAMTDSAQFMNRALIEDGKEQYDAIEASFQVSASPGLQDCYLLLVCDFTTDDKEDTIRRWIHLRTLDDITPKPRKVHLFDGGLPPGFKLLAHEFHIYSGGREVATNLSDKRIELTEDEAFTFMNLQYIGAHRGETLPPVLAWSEVPADLADRLPPDVLRWSIHVRVDAEGRVIGIAADEEGKRGAPKRVVDTIRTFRFNPALDKGKPVPGKVVLRIADFLPPLPE